MRGKNALGWILILVGSFSLIVGWPWGALVGAILILSGVLAMKLDGRVSTPVAPQPNSQQPIQTDATQNLAEQLLGRIRSFQSREEAVPDETMNELRHLMTMQGEIRSDTISGLKQCIDIELDAVFRRYDAVIMKTRNETIDLGVFARDFRLKFNFPAHGPVLGHDSASEEMNLVLTRIEELNGKVPIPESLFFVAVCDNAEGIEANYLKERQKKGYGSLFENEPNLEWDSNPGFYERQLQRRHDNILFPPPKRSVSRYDIYVSRWLDQQERTSFLQKWGQFNEEWEKAFRELGRNTAIRDAFRRMDAISWVSELNALLDTVIYMDPRTAQRIQELYGIVWSEAHAFLSGPEAIRAGRSIEELRDFQRGDLILDFAFRQIMRLSDEADFAPALISEDVETIETAVRVLKDSVLHDVRGLVSKWIEESPEVKTFLMQKPMKLVALGVLEVQSSATVQ